MEPLEDPGVDDLPYVVWYQCRMCTHLYFDEIEKMLTHFDKKHGAMIDTEELRGIIYKNGLVMGGLSRIPQSHEKNEAVEEDNDNDAETDLISPDPPYSDEFYGEEEDHMEFGVVTKHEIKKELKQKTMNDDSEEDEGHNEEEYDVYDTTVDEGHEKGEIVGDYDDYNSPNDIDMDPAQLCEPSHLQEYGYGEEEEDDEGDSAHEEYNQGYQDNDERSLEDYENDEEDGNNIAIQVQSKSNKPLQNYGYSCKFCGLFFTTRRGADTHEQNHKAEGSSWSQAAVKRSGDPVGKRFPCRICKKEVFLSFKDLKAHLKTHAPDRIHICKFCFITFNNTASLTKHLAIHTVENPHKCHCGKSFVSANTLKIHKKIHTGIKPFVCEYHNCGRAFVTKSTLESHIRTHTGEKPFQCGFCDSSFTTSSAKYRHERHVHKVPEPAII